MAQSASGGTHEVYLHVRFFSWESMSFRIGFRSLGFLASVVISSRVGLVFPFGSLCCTDLHFQGIRVDSRFRSEVSYIALLVCVSYRVQAQRLRLVTLAQ